MVDLIVEHPNLDCLRDPKDRRGGLFEAATGNRCFQLHQRRVCLLQKWLKVSMVFFRVKMTMTFLGSTVTSNHIDCNIFKPSDWREYVHDSSPAQPRKPQHLQ